MSTTTKTIVIDNPDDYQEGDLFTGIKYYADGVNLVVSDAPLRKGFGGMLIVPGTPGGLYASAFQSKWENVRVTREVAIPSRYIKFAPGSVVQHKLSGSRFLAMDDGGWVSTRGYTFKKNHPDIRRTIEHRKTFEGYYTLIDGSYEDADD